MSAYVSGETQFTDEEALVSALIEVGSPRMGGATRAWDRSSIEVHKTPKNLTGYRGDTRAQKAHIIIPRSIAGRASNDIGFEKSGDTYTAHISEYDKSVGYNESWLGKVKQSYMTAVAIKNAKRQGYRVKKTVKDSKVTLTLTKF